ncbi:MAG: hypothetical protein O3B24_05170 [Verrucomicrobia bacterium]|nr:hypothetical protein [Verrucomicrobiota bacterium]
MIVRFRRAVLVSVHFIAALRARCKFFLAAARQGAVVEPILRTPA